MLRFGEQCEGPPSRGYFVPFVSDGGRWRLSIDGKTRCEENWASRLSDRAQNATERPHPIISIHGAKQQTPVATNDASRNKTQHAPGKRS